MQDRLAQLKEAYKTDLLAIGEYHNGAYAEHEARELIKKQNTQPSKAEIKMEILRYYERYPFLKSGENHVFCEKCGTCHYSVTDTKEKDISELLSVKKNEMLGIESLLFTETMQKIKNFCERNDL